MNRLITFLLFLLPSLILWSQHSVPFDKFAIDKGLSDSDVSCIIQDKTGFLWVGTSNGLNCYDGYHIRVFKKGENSIVGNNILTLFEDSKGLIWIGTDQGISVYNSIDNTFTSYISNELEENSLSDNQINAFAESEDGAIWIGANLGINKFDKKRQQFSHFVSRSNNSQAYNITDLQIESEVNLWATSSTDGLILFNIVNEEFVYYRVDRANSIGLTSNSLHSIKIRNRELWIGTDNGLNMLNLRKMKIKVYNTSPESKPVLTSNNIRALDFDDLGNLWVGTDKGIDIVNLKSKKAQNVQNSTFDPNSLNNNTINSIFTDINGIVWLGTPYGVNSYDKSKHRFSLYKPKAWDTNSPRNENTWAFYQDNVLNLWVGTDKGLDKFHIPTGKYTHYPIVANKTPNKRISSITGNGSHIIWMATGEGLAKFNSKTDETQFFTNIPGNQNNLSGINIKAISLDNNNTVWIVNAVGELNAFNTKTETFARYIPKVYIANKASGAWAINIDTKNFIWLGMSESGLIRFDKTSKGFLYSNHTVNDKSTISSNKVSAIFEDSKSRIWVGTSDAGLNLYSQSTNTFKRFSTENGLPSNHICGITEDQSKNLWISTTKGICRMNTEDETFKTYTESEGVQGYKFNQGAVYKSSDDKLHFGGINGYNSFLPTDITKHESATKPTITHLFINEQEIEPLRKYGGRLVLDKSIVATKDLTFTHTEKSITFQFSSFWYNHTNAAKYAYILEPFDKKWQSVKNHANSASYTSLPPGEYTFKLKAQNISGIWTPNQNILNVKITIKPPFWGTLGFRALMVMLLLIVIYLWNKNRLKITRAKNVVLQKEIDQKADKIHKLSKLRTNEQKESIAKDQEIQELTEAIGSKDGEIEKQILELKKLHIITSETNNSIFTFSPNGVIDWANKGFQTLTGYTLTEFTRKFGNTFSQVSTIKDNHLKLEECKTQKIPVKYESELQNKFNKILRVQTTITPVLDNRKQIIKFVVINTDITKIKEAETNITKLTHTVKRQEELIGNSLDYARTMQNAILPSHDQLNNIYRSRVIYKAQNEVSGDFYWHTEVPELNYTFYIAVDCTGHGISGAFMTIIANKLLNQIIKAAQIYDPAEILKELNNRFVEILKQENSESHDGMEVALCRIENREDNSTELAYAGAKRPLFVFRNAFNQLETIHGDRLGIGGVTNRNRPAVFSTETMPLSPKDTLFLTSDGMINQNDINRKRYGSVKFRDLLGNIAHLALIEQTDRIESALKQHMKGVELRDDICILIVKL